MNQSELVAAYEFLSSACDRVSDIQTLDDQRLGSQCKQLRGEIRGLMGDLLPLIGRTVVEDR